MYNPRRWSRKARISIIRSSRNIRFAKFWNFPVSDNKYKIYQKSQWKKHLCEKKKYLYEIILLCNSIRAID